MNHMNGMNDPFGWTTTLYQYLKMYTTHHRQLATILFLHFFHFCFDFNVVFRNIGAVICLKGQTYEKLKIPRPKRTIRGSFIMAPYVYECMQQHATKIELIK